MGRKSRSHSFRSQNTSTLKLTNNTPLSFSSLGINLAPPQGLLYKLDAWSQHSAGLLNALIQYTLPLKEPRTESGMHMRISWPGFSVASLPDSPIKKKKPFLSWSSEKQICCAHLPLSTSIIVSLRAFIFGGKANPKLLTGFWTCFI